MASGLLSEKYAVGGLAAFICCATAGVLQVYVLYASLFQGSMPMRLSGLMEPTPRVQEDVSIDPHAVQGILQKGFPVL